jgi:hypothetical protein
LRFLKNERFSGPLQLFGLAFLGSQLLGPALMMVAFGLEGSANPARFADRINNAVAETAWWVGLSVAFCVGAELLTRNSCSFGLALRYFLLMVGVAVAGGVIGALTSPTALLPAAVRPHLLVLLLVGGALPGVHMGSLIGLTLALVLLRAAWLRQQAQDAALPEVSERWTPTPGRGTGIIAGQDGTHEEPPERP